MCVYFRIGQNLISPFGALFSFHWKHCNPNSSREMIPSCNKQWQWKSHSSFSFNLPRFCIVFLECRSAPWTRIELITCSRQRRKKGAERCLMRTINRRIYHVGTIGMGTSWFKQWAIQHSEHFWAFFLLFVSCILPGVLLVYIIRERMQCRILAYLCAFYAYVNATTRADIHTHYALGTIMWIAAKKLISVCMCMCVWESQRRICEIFWLAKLIQSHCNQSWSGNFFL